MTLSLTGTALSFATQGDIDTYLANNPTSPLAQKFYELRVLLGDTAQLFLPATYWNEGTPVIDQAMVTYGTTTNEILDYFQHRFNLLRGI